MGHLKEADKEQSPRHVLLFPFPCPSHVNTMLNLAEIFCLSGLRVTFLVTPVTHHRLLHHTGVYTHFEAEYLDTFRFETIPVGEPDEDPMCRDVASFRAAAKPLLREFLVGENRFGSIPQIPISCMVTDGVVTFAIDIAQEFGIQVFTYRPCSAANIWFYFCASELLQTGVLPFKGKDLDVPVLRVPETDTFVRRRDLPNFCRGKEFGDGSPFQMILNETLQTPRSQALIVDTFEELEGPILNQIRSHCPVYAIGPLHAQLKTRRSSTPMSSNCFWKDDANCMPWLNTQPSRSVIYISFGSALKLTKDQLMELWHGIMNSGKRFLLVIRPGSIASKDCGEQIVAELVAATPERGYLVSWAAQEAVLAHQAIGAFLTHSGWSSTAESIIAGVPMICWPFSADQQIQSRFVGEVWKIGLDMKDTNDRVVVEKMIRELMDNRRDEFTERASLVAESANKAISKGGSSYRNLDLLIEATKTKGVKTSFGNGLSKN